MFDATAILASVSVGIVGWTAVQVHGLAVRMTRIETILKVRGKRGMDE